MTAEQSLRRALESLLGPEHNVQVYRDDDDLVLKMSARVAKTLASHIDELWQNLRDDDEWRLAKLWDAQSGIES